MTLAMCNTKTDQQGRELTLHGTGLFPIACYHDDLLNNPVPWHWHDELEIAIVTKGAAVLAVGTERFILRQGQGFFINSKVFHGVWSYGHSKCWLHSAVFLPRLVGGSLDSIFWQKYMQPLLDDKGKKSVCFDHTESWHEEALKIIEESWQIYAEESPGYELQVRSSLSRFTFLLTSHHTVANNLPSEKEIRNERRIKQMLQFIQQHYNNSELTIAMIASSAMISESECLRCFHNTIGTSPIQYLKQFRIQKAVELLTSTKESVSEIGVLCGFQDASYFTKTFRELKGCTPSECRKSTSSLQ